MASVGEVVVRFDDREVSYGFGELNSLMPAFATTIHKGRGSEYPAVVIPVVTQHYPMLSKRHLQRRLREFRGILQADAYSGFNALYESGRVVEAASLARRRRRWPVPLGG